MSAVLGVLSRGGAPAAAEAAGEVAAAGVEQQQLGAGLPVELDEFGRDVNAERKLAAAARARRRAVRLADVQQRLQAGPAGQQVAAAAGGPQAAQPMGEVRLGDETSEESEGEEAHYSSRQSEIQVFGGGGVPWRPGLLGMACVRCLPGTLSLDAWAAERQPQAAVQWQGASGHRPALNQPPKLPGIWLCPPALAPAVRIPSCLRLLPAAVRIPQPLPSPILPAASRGCGIPRCRR